MYYLNNEQPDKLYFIHFLSFERELFSWELFNRFIFPRSDSPRFLGTSVLSLVPSTRSPKRVITRHETRRNEQFRCTRNSQAARGDWNSLEISRLATGRGSRISPPVVSRRDVERKSSALPEDRAKFHGKRRVFTLSRNRWWLSRRPRVRSTSGSSFSEYVPWNVSEGIDWLPTIYYDKGLCRCCVVYENDRTQSFVVSSERNSRTSNLFLCNSLNCIFHGRFIND